MIVEDFNKKENINVSGKKISDTANLYSCHSYGAGRMLRTDKKYIGGTFLDELILPCEELLRSF